MVKQNERRMGCTAQCEACAKACDAIRLCELCRESSMRNSGLLGFLGLQHPKCQGQLVDVTGWSFCAQGRTQWGQGLEFSGTKRWCPAKTEHGLDVVGEATGKAKVSVYLEV